MASQQIAYAGSDIEVLINVVDDSGNHVAAVINTGSTRVDGYASVIPSVYEVNLGIYKITFSGLSPAPTEGDMLVVKVNGSIEGVNWTTYGIPVKIVAIERGTDNAATPTDIAALNDLSAADVRTAVGLASADLDTQLGTLATSSDLTIVDTVVDSIKVVTDQFVFTNPGEVDANAVTGGISQADVRTAIGLASANLDTQLGDIPTVSEFNARSLASADYATSASISALNDLDATEIRAAVGLASANLDTQLGNLNTQLGVIDGIVDAIVIDTGTDIPALISGLQDLSQADIRTAVGLASANLDTQLGDIPTVSEFNARTLVSTDYATSASISGLQDLSQADVRTALGLANADLDTQLNDILNISHLDAADIRSAIGLASANIDTQLTDIYNKPGLSAADVRSAIGLTTANLDTQLGDIPTVAEFNARSLASADYSTSTQVSSLNNISAADVVNTLNSTNYDGVQYSDIMTIILSMAQGRIRETSTGVFEFYSQDNTTILYTLTKFGSERTRS